VIPHVDPGPFSKPPRSGNTLQIKAIVIAFPLWKGFVDHDGLDQKFVLVDTKLSLVGFATMIIPELVDLIMILSVVSLSLNLTLDHIIVSCTKNCLVVLFRDILDLSLEYGIPLYIDS
jgi:hypothetical protein